VFGMRSTCTGHAFGICVRQVLGMWCVFFLFVHVFCMRLAFAWHALGMYWHRKLLILL
jgi:hypothetical protein